jgi:hypothetical protein
MHTRFISPKNFEEESKHIQYYEDSSETEKIQPVSSSYYLCVALHGY